MGSQPNPKNCNNKYSTFSEPEIYGATNAGAILINRSHVRRGQQKKTNCCRSGGEMDIN